MLSSESRRVAGILLVVFPPFSNGGVSLLMFCSTGIRDTWKTRCDRTFFAPATRTPGCCWSCHWSRSAMWTRPTCPRDGSGMCALHTLRRHLLAGSIFLLCAFSLRQGTQRFIYLAYAGAVVLALGLLALGVGLLRNSRA